MSRLRYGPTMKEAKAIGGEQAPAQAEAGTEHQTFPSAGASRAAAASQADVSPLGV